MGFIFIKHVNLGGGFLFWNFPGKFGIWVFLIFRQISGEIWKLSRVSGNFFTWALHNLDSEGIRLQIFGKIFYFSVPALFFVGLLRLTRSIWFVSKTVIIKIEYFISWKIKMQLQMGLWCWNYPPVSFGEN